MSDAGRKNLVARIRSTGDQRQVPTPIEWFLAIVLVVIIVEGLFL